MHHPAGGNYIARHAAGDTAGILPIVRPDKKFCNGQAKALHCAAAQKQRNKAGHNRGLPRPGKACQIFVRRAALQVHGLIFTVRRQCAGGKPAVLPVQFGIRQQQLLQGIRFRQAVIIHNPQILCPRTRCLLDAAGKAARTTQVFAGIIIVHGWQVQLRHQFGRAVRAGIIDHPQFRHTGRLGTQSPQAALQHCLAVIRYNNRCRAFHL